MYWVKKSSRSAFVQRVCTIFRFSSSLSTNQRLIIVPHAAPAIREETLIKMKFLMTFLRSDGNEGTTRKKNNLESILICHLSRLTFKQFRFPSANINYWKNWKHVAMLELFNYVFLDWFFFCWLRSVDRCLMFLHFIITILWVSKTETYFDWRRRRRSNENQRRRRDRDFVSSAWRLMDFVAVGAATP